MTVAKMWGSGQPVRAGLGECCHCDRHETPERELYEVVFYRDDAAHEPDAVCRECLLDMLAAIGGAP